MDTRYYTIVIAVQTDKEDNLPNEYELHELLTQDIPSKVDGWYEQVELGVSRSSAEEVLNNLG